MKLSSLSMSGVRGFRDEYTFDLDADVVIVSGRNGTGKTSLFDAIQWALLGDIPRMRAIARSGEDYVSNRYAPTPPFVAANISTGEGSATVTRRGAGKDMKTGVSLEGQVLSEQERAQWLQSLLHASDASGRSFRRMFMLQQDDIKEFLYAETKERYEFLAELAGVGELQELDRQTKAELKKLRDATRQQLDRLDGETSRLEALRHERQESDAIIARQTDYLAGRSDDGIRQLRDLIGSDVAEPEQPEQLLRLAAERIANAERLLSLVEDQSRIAASVAARAAELTVQQPAIDQVAENVAQMERRQIELAREAEQLEQQARERALREEKLKQLASLALEELGERCPVCNQEYDRDHAIAHLNEILAHDTKTVELRQASGQRRHEAASLGTDLATLRAQQSTLVSRSDEAKALEQTKQRAREVAAAAWLELSTLLGLDPASEIDLKRAREAIEQIRSAQESAQTAARASQQRDTVVRRVATLESNLATQEKLLDTLRAESSSFEQALKEAESICTWLGERIVDATSSVVSSITPWVNQFYSRLDVHSTFRRFDFRSDRRYAAGHIRPWVYDDEEKVDGNAAQVLSSAQLNALAVCLFLSLNLAHAADLETVMLDDPIQNMDDLNVLSFVDVLRSLRVKRQVVISTHDPDLAQLLWRKLRPLHERERTVWLEFSDWTTDGPKVSVRAREGASSPEPLELVAA